MRIGIVDDSRGISSAVAGSRMGLSTARLLPSQSLGGGRYTREVGLSSEQEWYLVSMSSILHGWVTIVISIGMLLGLGMTVSGSYFESWYQIAGGAILLVVSLSVYLKRLDQKIRFINKREK